MKSNVKRKVIEGGATLDRDVAVAMRDGARLMVNVFRPTDGRPAPVVMSVTPYSKDTLPDWVYMTLVRLAGASWICGTDAPRHANVVTPTPRNLACSGRDTIVGFWVLDNLLSSPEVTLGQPQPH